MKYISIGGWCGSKRSLKYNGYEDATYPFDYVRSSMEGIIDCIETNFENYFPKNLEPDPKYKHYTAFIGNYIGFYHGDLRKQDTIDSYKRKIDRFHETLSSTTPICFLRSVCTENYFDEINLYKKFQDIMEHKYPICNYILVFIIPNQLTTEYYKNLNKNTFIFTLNDSLYDPNYILNTPDRLKHAYEPIYKYIETVNLFESIPEPKNIELIQKPSRVWYVDGYPMILETLSRDGKDKA